MFPTEWIEAAKALAPILGPAGIAGILIAWFGAKRHRKRIPSLSSEAIATIGQGIGNQFAIDRLTITLERVILACERLIDANDRLHGTIEDRFPRRKK